MRAIGGLIILIGLVGPIVLIWIDPQAALKLFVSCFLAFMTIAVIEGVKDEKKN